MLSTGSLGWEMDMDLALPYETVCGYGDILQFCPVKQQN
jgi:hypothetical protein